MRGFVLGMSGPMVPAQLVFYFYVSPHEPWHLILAACAALAFLAAASWSFHA